MNILVINGSPKGDFSCTLQTVLYLQKCFPEHSFRFLNAGKNIRSLEKDFSEAESLLADAELLLFSYPVYTFIAPSQLHRFVELLKASSVSLSGKFSTQITTSKHFYDITAHRYIDENCHDLGLKVIKGLSADMDDLLTEKGRQEALSFFRYVDWCISRNVHEPRPLPLQAPAHRPVSVPQIHGGSKPGNVALVADLRPDDVQLSAMIDRFCEVFPRQTHLINIHDFPFRGGCISCFHCAADGNCVYTDGFQQILRDEIQQSEAIVLAFSIRDHSMGSVFKTYDDRQFCNGHRTVTMGKPFGYLVSGDLSRESNLRMILDGRADVGGNFLAGIATDEFDPDSDIDTMAERLSYAVENHYVQPSGFLGVGGMKIFRDLIWLMRGLMRADHRFYREHGLYDFPQKKPGTLLKILLVGKLMNNPSIRKKIGNQMNEGMIAPYKKVLEKAADSPR